MSQCLSIFSVSFSLNITGFGLSLVSRLDSLVIFCLAFSPSLLDILWRWHECSLKIAGEKSKIGKQTNIASFVHIGFLVISEYLNLWIAYQWKFYGNDGPARWPILGFHPCDFCLKDGCYPPCWCLRNSYKCACSMVWVSKVKPLYRPKWPMGPALNSDFFSMKRLGVLLLPPGWDASPSQGYPQHICWYPFVYLGEEKHCESKVSA